MRQLRVELVLRADRLRLRAVRMLRGSGRAATRLVLLLGDEVPRVLVGCSAYSADRFVAVLRILVHSCGTRGAAGVLQVAGLRAGVHRSLRPRVRITAKIIVGGLRAPVVSLVRQRLRVG
jgi:hypothetical protein